MKAVALGAMCDAMVAGVATVQKADVMAKPAKAVKVVMASAVDVAAVVDAVAVTATVHPVVIAHPAKGVIALHARALTVRRAKALTVHSAKALRPASRVPMAKVALSAAVVVAVGVVNALHATMSVLQKTLLKT